MKSRIFKWLLLDLAILLIAMLYYVLIYILDTTCLIKKMVGVDCPTCGMTRSIICLINGDVLGYLSYNFLALPTFLVVYLSFHIKKEKTKKIMNALIIVLALMIFLRYIIKILYLGVLL